MNASRQSAVSFRWLSFLLLPLFFSIGSPARVDAQVFEMRHLFESFSDWRLLVGGSVFGPVNSQLDPNSARVNVPFDTLIDADGYFAVEYWQLRAGMHITAFSTLSPFLYWNPSISGGFGSDSSRWNASISWEGIFAQDNDFNPGKTLQPDNSVFTPKNSFSFLVGYWFGSGIDTAESQDVLQRAYPDLDPRDLERVAIMQAPPDTNYWGRGVVDTNSYRTAPLDTNTYVRGFLPPAEIPSPVPVRYITREGFSAALGFGSGQYAGSGPISKFLNIFYDDADLNDTTRLYQLGLSPMILLRYRYGDYIAQLEIAGEDVNAGVVVRSIRDFDIEIGVKFLEHLLYRDSRGPNRPGLFLGVRYSPPFRFGSSLLEKGEHIYTPAKDSDGDGIPDGYEADDLGTDPYTPDSDGDGIPDGLEVHTYKTNPLKSDSDEDGLSDGQEILTPSNRTDPLRGDTDEDGISDGEEVMRGTDPLIPAGGERGR